MAASDAPPGLAECAAAWALARRVEVDGVPVRYREAGRGVPIVLVHGLGVSADYWWRVGPALAARGYRVLALDLPGFGRTPGPRAGLSVPAQAAAVRGWSEALRLEPAVYVGHSLSCQSMVELAAADPRRVRALVLAGPTGAPIRWRLMRQAWGLLADIPRETLPLAAFVLQAYLQAGLPRVWRTWRMGREHQPLRAAPRVRAPALVVVGERDPVVVRPFAEQLAASLPRGRVVEVPGAPHAVIFNGAAGFNAAVLAFLDEVLSAG